MSVPTLADESAEAGPSRPRQTRAQNVNELQSLLSRETAKTRLRRLATARDVAFNPVCEHTTLATCKAMQDGCTKTHYEPIIRPWTDVSLGYCSYLNLCYGDPMFRKNPSLGDSQGPRGGTRECRDLSNLAPLRDEWPDDHIVGRAYMHFQVVPSTTRHVQTAQKHSIPPRISQKLFEDPPQTDEEKRAELVGQWVNCDLRTFDYSVLGQFQVIIADPPWDIHMTLPYGTMTDDEMRRLPIPALQPDWGILCLWVTGRAMELGRELLAVWGYKRVDELVWVKVNQLQRLIRTGRTGHWLNHTCEHLLIAVKLPQSFPRAEDIPWTSHPTLRALRKGIDTDVVVAEVRETSRKPDEVYGVIERLAPHGRKLELFGRKHNIRPGWLTLGNQLGDSQVAEKSTHDRLTARYPQQTFNLVQ